MSNVKTAADNIYIFLADAGYLVNEMPVSYSDLISGKTVIAAKVDEEEGIDELWAIEILKNDIDDIFCPTPYIKISKKVNPDHFGDNILEILNKMNEFNSGPQSGNITLFLRFLGDDSEATAFISAAISGLNINKETFFANIERINKLDETFTLSSIATFLDSLPPDERERIHREASKHAARSIGLDMSEDEMDSLLSQSDDSYLFEDEDDEEIDLDTFLEI